MSYNFGFEDSAPAQPVSLIPCSICGRNFNKKALERHQPICEKNASKKPAKLGATAKKSQERAKEIAAKQGILPGKKAEVPINSSKSGAGAGKNDWRSKREDMVAQMRYARAADRAAKQGTAMPEAPTLNHDPYEDYQQCPYCERKFNETAAKRHIEFCKKTSQRKPNVKPGVQAAAAKQNKRVMYKPPKLKKRDSVTSESPSVPKPSNKYGIGKSLEKHESTKPPPVRFSKPAQKLPSHCRSCKIEYPVDWAKFCPMCGLKRV